MPAVKKDTKNTMRIVIVADGKEGFFARGKEIAKAVDAGKSIAQEFIINFDSPEAMFAVLTKARRHIMVLLREKDASITDIVASLQRDRAAVAKDIKLLEQYGLVKVKRIVNPGHGYKKMVHIVSKQPIRLEATI